MQINELLQALVKNKASDLHIKVGRPPLFRVQGKLLPSKAGPLTLEEVKALLYSMMSQRQTQKYENDQEIDFSYEIQNLSRFRVNGFIQKGNVGIVIRAIPYKIPTIDEMGLPPVIKDLASKHRGLILVTGPTGSGKSTTLAAVIDYVNNTRACHVVTLEDPIEFVYSDKFATINQREIGLDTRSMAEGLRRALRQDPDLILVGEMRDPETINTAVTAAETGHLVLSTLHTNDARQSIDRIIDAFPHEQQGQIRQQLSSCLVAVIAQRLLRLASGQGRAAAMEIMINSPTISKMIAEGETFKLNQAIESSNTYYRMQSFNQHLYQLVKEGTVGQDEALANSNNPEDLRLRFSGIASATPGSMVTDGMADMTDLQKGKPFQRKDYLEVSLND